MRLEQENKVLDLRAVAILTADAARDLNLVRVRGGRDVGMAQVMEATNAAPGGILRDRHGRPDTLLQIARLTPAASFFSE